MMQTVATSATVERNVGFTTFETKPTAEMNERCSPVGPCGIICYLSVAEAKPMLDLSNAFNSPLSPASAGPGASSAALQRVLNESASGDTSLVFDPAGSIVLFGHAQAL